MVSCSVFLPPQWYGSPGSTPFPSICKLLAAFLRSSLVFARFLQRFWLPASHLLGTCYLLDNLRSTHTPSKYLRATYSYVYMCYVSTSYIYIYIKDTYVYIYIYICIYIHTHIHIYIHNYIYTHTYSYLYIYIYIYTYKYFHIHIYIYIHLHTYIYTYKHLYIYVYNHTPTTPQGGGGQYRGGQYYGWPMTIAGGGEGWNAGPYIRIYSGTKWSSIWTHSLWWLPSTNLPVQWLRVRSVGRPESSAFSKRYPVAFR